MTSKKDENYSAQEAQRRFEAALRGARIAGHKSKEIVTHKHSRPQQKKKQKQSQSVDRR
jgi:hypothetical protein